MDIPTNTEGWLEGGPWSEDHVPFSEEELQKAPPFQRYFATNGKRLNRDTHEMSHLVYVDDEHMFHPMWGEALPDTWPVDPEGARREACVFAIESVIWAHMNQAGRVPLVHLTNLTIRRPIGSQESRDDYNKRREAFRTELDALTSITASEWPIERVWAELQRKYLLVNSWTPGEEIDQATTDAQLDALCTIFGIDA